MSLQVQGTNDSSIVSKCSMVDRGYFEDKYIHCFVEKTSRRSPIINIGYCVRAVVINSVLEDFVKNGNPSGAVQIVSFGAGFDTSYFRLSDIKDSENSFFYYEIDLLNVVKRKKKIILNSNVLVEKILNVEDSISDALKSSNYNLLACDLSDISNTQKCLIDAGFNPDLPTLFLAECSITYMNEESSTNLINWAGNFVRDGAFVTYEQINPFDGFGLKMMKHFSLQQSPLLSLEKFPTISSQKKRYEDNGWSKCDVIPAWTAFSGILSAEEMHSKLNLEPFDEWEEWHLKCNHYALAVARNGVLNNWQPQIINLGCGNITNSIKGFNDTQPLKWTLNSCTSIQRFAHTSVLFGQNNKYVLTIGGFGIFENGAHRRLNNIMCSEYPLDVKRESIKEVVCDNLAIRDCMHHTCTTVAEKTGEDFEEVSLVLYGGRTSPVNCVNSNPLLLKCRFSEGSAVIKCEELVENTSTNGRPAPRWRHSACVMDLNCEKWFVVFGGCSTKLKIFDDLWLLNLDDNSRMNKKWIICESSENKPEARFSHSSTVWKESNMIVACGLGANNKVFDDIWLWNFKTRSWKDLNIHGVIPRYGHTSNVFNNNLLLVGGVTTVCEVTPGVAVINLELLFCHEYQLPSLDPSTSIMLHNHSTIFDDEKESLVVIGGGGNCFSFGTHLNSHLVEISLRQFQV